MLCTLVLPFGAILIQGRIEDILGKVPAVKNRNTHWENPSKPKFWEQDLTSSSLLGSQQIFVCIFALTLQY